MSAVKNLVIENLANRNFAVANFVGKSSALKNIALKGAAVKSLAALLALSLLFLTGCLPFGSSQAAKSFITPLDSRLIAAVPFIADDSSHCGPSTLAAVMTYHGRYTTKEEVAVDVQREDLKGSLGPDLVLWARANGVNATFASLKPEELITRINQLKPVIALLDTGIGPVHRGHFVVVVGYNPDGVVANSGLIQQQVISWSDFLTQWYKTGNFAILVSAAETGAVSEEAGENETSSLQAPQGEAQISAQEPGQGETGQKEPGKQELSRQERELQEQGLDARMPSPQSAQNPPPKEAVGVYISPSPYLNIPIPKELQGADIPQTTAYKPEPIINMVPTQTPSPPLTVTDDAPIARPSRDMQGNFILPVVPLPEQVDDYSPGQASSTNQASSSSQASSPNQVSPVSSNQPKSGSITEETLIRTPPPDPIPLPTLPNAANAKDGDSQAFEEKSSQQESVPVMSWERRQ